VARRTGRVAVFTRLTSDSMESTEVLTLRAEYASGSPSSSGKLGCRHGQYYPTKIKQSGRLDWRKQSG
jgi:hypothetical protein